MAYYTRKPELVEAIQFEVIPDYKFKLLYQPDACSLDGSDCE